MSYGFYTWLSGGGRTPVGDSAMPKNGETLAQHRKHCKAKPGNCPFVKSAAKEASAEDDIRRVGIPDAVFAPVENANYLAEMTSRAQVVECDGFPNIVAVGNTMIGYSFDSLRDGRAAFRKHNPVGSLYRVGGRNGEELKIWSNCATEYVGSQNTRWLRSNDKTGCRAKLALIPHLSTVLQNAVPQAKGVAPEHPHKRNRAHYASFDYYRVMWAVRKPMQNVMVYSGRVICNRHEDGHLEFLDVVEVVRLR